MALVIHTIPAFQDNYLWLFHQSDSKEAFVVDPGDAHVVHEKLKALGLTLGGILITHHHPDHTGGINALLNTYAVPVYGPHSPHIPQIDQPQSQGSRITLADTSFTVLEIPGHTLDHIAFFAEPTNEAPLVFAGDTLFTAGCGRIFEGTAEQMYTSLEKLNALPSNTRVYCAHEYTLSNLAFAAAVEPDNAAIQNKITTDTAKRAANTPTVPSTLKVERETNPFLRCSSPHVIAAANNRVEQELKQAVDVLREIRHWKDNFKA